MRLDDYPTYFFGPFINTQMVFATKQRGPDKNVESRVSLIDVNGELLFEGAFPKGDILREGISRSANGQQFAMALLKTKGGARCSIFQGVHQRTVFSFTTS
jgi:hypothetical protein